jgi:DNA polymerase-4
MELTFDENVEDSAAIEAEITRMAGELAEHAAAAERRVTGVVVKVRFAPFFTTSRSVRLDGSSAKAAPIIEAAMRALGRFELDRPVRLVGVKVDFE